MLKFFRNQFGMIVSMIIALILSLCMASVATFRAATATNPVTVEWIIRNWGTAFLVIMLTSILLPSKIWGDTLAGKVGLKEGTLPFGLVSNLVPTFFYNTFATLVLVGVNVGFGGMDVVVDGVVVAHVGYWASVWADYLLMFVISYVLSLIAERIGMLVAVKATIPHEDLTKVHV